MQTDDSVQQKPDDISLFMRDLLPDIMNEHSHPNTPPMFVKTAGGILVKKGSTKQQIEFWECVCLHNHSIPTFCADKSRSITLSATIENPLDEITGAAITAQAVQCELQPDSKRLSFREISMQLADPVCEQLSLSSEFSSTTHESDDSDPIELPNEQDESENTHDSESDSAASGASQTHHHRPELEQNLGESPRGSHPSQTGGIGVCLQRVAGRLLARAIAPNGPADGILQPGDEILRIDGAGTDSLGLTDALCMLRGRVGTAVALCIRTTADGSERPVNIRRECQCLLHQGVQPAVPQPGKSTEALGGVAGGGPRHPKRQASESSLPSPPPSPPDAAATPRGVEEDPPAEGSGKRRRSGPGLRSVDDLYRVLLSRLAERGAADTAAAADSLSESSHAAVVVGAGADAGGRLDCSGIAGVPMDADGDGEPGRGGGDGGGSSSGGDSGEASDGEDSDADAEVRCAARVRLAALQRIAVGAVDSDGDSEDGGGGSKGGAGGGRRAGGVGVGLEKGADGDVAVASAPAPAPVAAMRKATVEQGTSPIRFDVEDSDAEKCGGGGVGGFGDESARIFAAASAALIWAMETEPTLPAAAGGHSSDRVAAAATTEVVAAAAAAAAATPHRRTRRVHLGLAYSAALPAERRAIAANARDATIAVFGGGGGGGGRADRVMAAAAATDSADNAPPHPRSGRPAGPGRPGRGAGGSVAPGQASTTCYQARASGGPLNRSVVGLENPAAAAGAAAAQAFQPHRRPASPERSAGGLAAAAPGRGLQVDVGGGGGHDAGAPGRSSQCWAGAEGRRGGRAPQIARGSPGSAAATTTMMMAAA
jgi:hypothetical protein